MKKRFVWLTVFVLLASAASAYTIADYPRMLFDHGSPTIVSGKGDSQHMVAVNLLAMDLQRYAFFKGLRNKGIIIVEPGDSKARGDEIVIGTPCGNSRIRELLGIAPGRCTTLFSQQQAQIILYQDDKVHLVIMGSDGSRILDAVKFLLNGNGRQQLNKTSIPIVRMQRVVNNVARDGTFLSIGQTLGAAGNVVYGSSSGVVRSTELPATECPIVTRTLTSGQTVQVQDCSGTVFYGGVPTRNINILGSQFGIGR